MLRAVAVQEARKVSWCRLFDVNRGQYIVATIRLKGSGKYALYYDKTPRGCRWATERGAQACIDRLVKSGTVPAEGHGIVVKEGGR